MTVVQGTTPAKVIPLARGQVQTAKILQQLSQLSPADAGLHGIGEAVRRSLALGRVKGRTLFFVVSDLETEADLYSLRHLLAMSHEAVIISPYTPLFEAHGLQGLDKIVFAIRTSHQWRTRRKLLHEAASMGLPLFDVGPKDLFPQLVMRVEELRRRGGS